MYPLRLRVRDVRILLSLDFDVWPHNTLTPFRWC